MKIYLELILIYSFFYRIHKFYLVQVQFMSYTQLVRIDTEVKELLDNIGKKKETYSNIIKRIIETHPLFQEVKQIA